MQETGLIRLLSLHHFDCDRRRFTSEAFRNSSDGSGISVFGVECADRESNGACAHISRHYRTFFNGMAVFWRIRTSELPGEVDLGWKESSTGDPRHINLKGLQRRQARRFFKKVVCPDGLEVCRDGERRPLDDRDIDDIVSQRRSRIQ